MFKITAIVLMLAGRFYSCIDKEYVETSNDFFWEIPLNSKNSVINKKVDGIEVKFCLLNEKGKPATQFKQGENFSFYFAMINHRKDKLNTLDFLECDIRRSNGFGQVISLKQDTICASFVRNICIPVINHYPFYGKDNKRELNVHWDDQQIRWSEINGVEIFQLPPLLVRILYRFYS